MAVSMSSIPSASSVFAAYASISAFIMLIQTMLNQLIPRQLQHYVIKIIHYYFTPNPTKATIVIEERDGLSTNEVYNAAETYLCTRIRPNIERLKITKRPKDTNLSIKFAQSEKITDNFQGVPLEWQYVYELKKKSTKMIDQETDDIVVESEKRCFELLFDKAHKNLVLEKYVPYVIEQARCLKEDKKVVRLHTLACGSSYNHVAWDSINLEHPSTFDTLAMEPKVKKSILEDLDRFVRRKDFYRKVGRAWKRGYLLYGPPGTGKSSLIAAMANYLKFDIYDLELTNVRRDSDLRRLLLRTANRSILVIEDIDCSVQLPDRQKVNGKGKPGMCDGPCAAYNPRDQQFTLSGLLNFIDGLWSSCGDERIIVFTTNNKDKLDPALLRPGRMDMHVHMSYLKMEGFKLLASTYLNVNDQHPSFEEIKELLDEMKVTPAEVAEELIKSDDADTALDGLVEFLRFKKDGALSDSSMGEGIEDEEMDQVKEESGVLSTDESSVEAVMC